MPHHRVLFVVLGALVFFVFLTGLAWACVPQRGELDVDTPLLFQDSETIVGDNSNVSLQWCNDIHQEARADANNNITVTVDEGPAPNGCPDDDGRNKLPEGDNVIYFHDTDAWTYDSTDGWEPVQGEGCFVNVEGDNPDPGDFQGAHQDDITVASDGSGMESFNLDLSNAGSGESADDDTASMLCIGEQNQEDNNAGLNDEDWVGIMAPVVTNPSTRSTTHSITL